MPQNETITIYLLIHGITTIGAVIMFLLRTENRLTKTETRLDTIERQHNAITAYGMSPHPQHPFHGLIDDDETR
jgi:hypothetical protein